MTDLQTSSQSPAQTQRRVELDPPEAERVDELELLLAGRRGDDAAFTELVARLGPPLSAYLWSRLRDVHEVEEVRQECLLRALSARRVPENRDGVRPWLFTIASHQATDRQRRGRARRLRLTADVVTPEAVPAADPASDPPRLAALRERDRGITAAVDQLPESQREVVLLHCYGGLTFREIAEIQRAPRSTVLARMRYAVDKLRGILAPRSEP